MSRQFTVLVLALFLLFLSLSTTQADSISAPNCAITSTQSTELPTFQAQLPCSMGLYEITGFDVNVSKNPPEFVGIPTLSENSGKILILAQWAMESPGTLIIDVNLTGALLQSSGIWNYTIGSTYHPDWLALYNVIATMDICLGGNFDTNNNCSGNLLTSSTAASTHEVATVTIPVPILNEFDIHTRSVFTHDGSKPGFDFSGGPALSFATLPPLDSEGPVTSNVSAAPNPVAVNTAMTLTATVDDTTTGGSTIATAEYSLDGGSLVPMDAQDGAFDAVSEDVEATILAFTEAGVHKVCVVGTDTASNIGPEECILLAVFDATAGFVTGGGWLQSPEGAYTPDPLLTGKANFGFVSKYQQGASTPTGVTEFQFKVANLNFHSDTYEWLVVAGARAQFKGTGTINTRGDYGFMLTAIDGQIPGGGGVDKFRIKIWDKTTEVIVYDNKLGADDIGNDATELGGGGIVIHKK